MLRNIHIKEFRSCSELLIDNIDELTILVGKNGVGKSNILKALSWCADIATSNNQKNYGHQPFNIKIEVELAGDLFVYTVDGRIKEINEITNWYLSENLSIIDGDDERWIFNKTGSNLNFVNAEEKFEVGDTSPALFSIFNLKPNYAWIDKLRNFYEFLIGVKYYPLIEVENVNESYNSVFVTQEQFNNWLLKRQSENDVKTVLVKILDFYLNKKDKFEELLILLGENGIGLISNIEITPLELPKSAVGEQSLNSGSLQEKTKIYFLSFRPIMSGSNEGFKFDSLSFGTKRLIRFLTDFLYDTASVSLVEQPEDGVHCGLLYKLFDLLDSYSEDRQTIVASHSVDLLNRARPEDIRLVEMEGGKTTVRQLSSKEQSAANDFKKSSGTLSEFLRSLQD